MITDNELYKEILNLKKKIEFLSNPKNTNETKADFWRVVGVRLNSNIIEYIEKDKRMYKW